MEQDVNITPELQEDIKLGDALRRLRKNKDFKLLISDLFLDEGIKHFVTNIPVVKDREAINEQLAARGLLYRYLLEIEQNSLSAMMALEEEE